MNLGSTAEILMQVASPAQKLARWRNNVKDHPLDLYIGKRRVVHTGNWLINVRLLPVHCTIMYGIALSLPNDSSRMAAAPHAHAHAHASSLLRMNCLWTCSETLRLCKIMHDKPAGSISA